MAYNFDDDADVGLGEEDNGRVQSKRADWYKGVEGRTDVVAFLCFNSIEEKLIRKAAKKKAEEGKEPLTEADVSSLRKRAVELAAKNAGKTDLSTVTDVDMLDLKEPRFKLYELIFDKREGFKFILSRKGKDGPDADIVWSKLPAAETKVTTLLFQYPTTQDGDVDEARIKTSYKLVPWKFGPDKFEVIKALSKGSLKNGFSLAEQDISLKCKGSEFQKMDITLAGPALWLKQGEAFKHQVLTQALKRYPTLIPGKEWSTPKLMEMLGLNNKPATGGGTSASVTPDVPDADYNEFLKDV